jgi:hypothetical protein
MNFESDVRDFITIVAFASSYTIPSSVTSMPFSYNTSGAMSMFPLFHNVIPWPI